MTLKDWLHSYVYSRGEFVKRGKLFKEFLKDGLLPFIEYMGYTVGTNPIVLYSYIVSGLYENREKTALESKWDSSYFQQDSIPEDRHHYYDTIDGNTWNEFWKSWNDIEDFSEDSFRGRDRRTDIEDLIWRQIDLENSYQTEILYYMMNDEYEVEIEDTSKKVDIYLLETTGWGGLR